MRVLLTGSSGFLGSAAVVALRARGHEVATIGRRAGVDTAVCDLADPPAVRAAVRRLAEAGPCDAVVHLAARAHGFRGLSLEDLRRANVVTTRALLDALSAAGLTPRVRFVLASSVAVYDLLDAADADPRAAPYAASKLEAEEIVRAEPFPAVRMLRFAPIYDREHLVDVAKRVYLPGTRLKVRLIPPPSHSLCLLDRAVAALVEAVESPSLSGLSVADIADVAPTCQHELVSWFPGPAMPVPTWVFRAAACGLSRCGETGRRVAVMIRKFIGFPSCGHRGYRRDNTVVGAARPVE
jgi:nucleoside-diphosphate-sugar epimerase